MNVYISLFGQIEFEKKILIIFFSIIVIAGFIIFFILNKNEEETKKKIIRVDGFDMEYTITERKLKIEEFNILELGSSLDEIENILGAPDGWIGSGILRPVYVLENENTVVCYFLYPHTCEELKKIEVFYKKGGKVKL